MTWTPKFKPGDFDYVSAWSQWAKPRFDALPADIRAIYEDIRDHYSFLQQQGTGPARWPKSEEEMQGRDPLQIRLENVDAGFLARAVPVVHSLGHWMSNGNDGGAYWRFEGLAKQVLIAKGPECCTWDEHKCDTKAFIVLSAEEKAIDDGLVDSGLTRHDVINCNHDPHPFMIGNQHFPKNRGMFIQPHQAPCAMRGCNLSYDKHTSNRVLVLKGLQMEGNTPVTDQEVAIRFLVSVLEAHNIDGMTFLKEE